MNGYYIVHYEDDGWDSLTGLLTVAHTTISSNDRASLINNAFQLVSNGKLSIEKALDLTLYLKRETEIMPVFQGLNELIPMYKLMEKRDMNEVENQFKVEAFNKVNSYVLVCFCAGVGRHPHHCVCMYVFIYVKITSNLTQYWD
ncbi:endoplasmic reticulum aminopeptidase 1-like [Ailuropoda melanoleuca]|uniref:endoplasmic reticulum aminopeptidase 1-like n=1 Tax=Ailuropoda melanoleuca TaxID=9646 RepID=UPI001494956D|nr:endoplasmic reticulum aminopeptidase 1-like [Ailuropoda melanoleuca]